VTALSTPADSPAEGGHLDLASGGDSVEVRVPADVAYIATLRLTAASLAARCDLTIDDIEDLRLAVDEACALLLPHAGPEARLDASFVLRPGELAVTASVTADDSAASKLDRTGFAWSVLSALASELDVASTADRLAITVTKRRETASQ
jgi:serine/threonine-protein kinase RsbW